MYRFFVRPEQIRDGNIEITGDDVHHIRQVLRMRPGEEVLVSSGDDWEYTCRITALEDERVSAQILDVQKPGRELASRLYLFQCIPKGDKMEWIIQKAVELGVYQIIPVASRRCVVKLDGKKAESRLARWNAVAASAAKQSKRMIVPGVMPLQNFSEALRRAEELDVRLIPYERAEGMAATRRLLGQILPGHSVGILIGPEGGFEEEEVKAAEQAGFCSVTLGKRILRTETAGITALSILMYLLEQD